ncbi:EpsG family protein [Millionella massiliensis]|uniref:EpsG family protein n=1 Tax=Millionella massiliensis TaxID=1871023 RepID=UPI0009F48002|nr:EpsG family protein [Millionella massiliensis]
MGIYIVIAFVCILFSLLENVAAGRAPYRMVHLYFYVAICLLLFFVAGTRECGFDYYNYYRYFEELNNPHWLSRGLKIGSEPGYSLLNYLTGNYVFVILVMSGLIVGMQCLFFWKYSRLPILSLVFYLGLFMYPSTMGQFRQALAMAFVLWAIVNRENKGKFFGWILLAMMFHFSAIIGILSLFVPKKVQSFKFYVIVFGLAVVCSVTTQIAYLRFIDMMPTYVATKLAHYASVEGTALGINSAVMLRGFVFFACYYYRKRLFTIPHMEFFLNIYFLSLIIYTALGFAPQVAGRGSIYFSIFEIIIIANLVFTLKGIRRYAVMLLFISFSIYRQWSFFAEWEQDYIPYRTWLLNMFG